MFCPTVQNIGCQNVCVPSLALERTTVHYCQLARPSPDGICNSTRFVTLMLPIFIYLTPSLDDSGAASSEQCCLVLVSAEAVPPGSLLEHW